MNSQASVAKSPNSKRLQTVIGFVVTAAFCVWMYFAMDWKEVFEQLANVNYWVLLPCTALFFVQFVLRTVRWRFLLIDGEKIGLRDMFDAIMVGNFATYILPLRAGEFIRPFILARKSGYSFAAGFVSVVLERFFDLMAVLISFGVVAVFIENIPPAAKTGAYTLSVLAIAIFLFIVVGSVLPAFVLRIADFFLRWLPAGIASKIRNLLNDVLRGARVLTNPRNLIAVSLLTAVVWISTYYLFYVYFALVGIELDIWAAVTASVIVALAVAAPSAPGFLGVYEFACIAGLGMFGVKREVATSLAIVSHVLQFVLLAVYGVYFLLTNKMRLGDLQSSAAQKVDDEMAGVEHL